MDPVRKDDFLWELPKGWVDGMQVAAQIFATPSILAKAVEDRAADQIANVATLPGVVGAMAMPDIHWGYGFPIGGVAATDIDSGGVVSPGGVGFDIGCGVRLLRSDLSWDADVRHRISELVRALSSGVPKGVGGKGWMPVGPGDLEKVLTDGVRFPLSQGVGIGSDEEFCEDSGVLHSADPSKISDRAKERGGPQLGSLGAGNHFLEVQVVDEIRDEAAARAMKLELGQVCVMIHSGSRGIGHQTCTDYVKDLDRLMPQLGIDVPDRQLACLPLDHPKAQDYMGAMDAAGNFARANRHVLAEATRAGFAKVFSRDAGLELVYDISHNLAKRESYEIDGRRRELCVHRKGATRAFGPGHPELPETYAEIGQPVIIPGSMGTASFILVGKATAAERSFASTCHGAGRAMSRTKAKKRQPGHELRKELADKGIIVSAGKTKLLAEEAPYAYKDVSEVVETCEGAGLTGVVARLRPVGVIKG